MIDFVYAAGHIKGQDGRPVIVGSFDEGGHESSGWPCQAVTDHGIYQKVRGRQYQ